jgi:hypothetical protein
MSGTVSMSCSAAALFCAVSDSSMPCFGWYGLEKNSAKVNWNGARTENSNNPVMEGNNAKKSIARQFNIARTSQRDEATSFNCKDNGPMIQRQCFYQRHKCAKIW